MKKINLTVQEELLCLAEPKQLASNVSIDAFSEVTGANTSIILQRLQEDIYEVNKHFKLKKGCRDGRVNMPAMLELLKKHRTTEFDACSICPESAEEILTEYVEGELYLPFDEFMYGIGIMPYKVTARLLKGEWQIAKHVIIDFDKKINPHYADIYINVNEVQRWARSFSDSTVH